ncbi:hypothetical protein QOZ95_004457 [Paenibacillus brasilensis]|uniref:Uncharacterized protein n=1 Tax=Paenibacillus brasilensis TaxID=128574 RepID=A0ABU0L4P3_9BACL|nr:hypothetical protein [Paenibacillus brasilensis]
MLLFVGKTKNKNLKVDVKRQASYYKLMKVSRHKSLTTEKRNDKQRATSFLNALNEDSKPFHHSRYNNPLTHLKIAYTSKGVE